MKEARTYAATATVEFNVAEGIDPFYWTDKTGAKVWRMNGIYEDITTEAGMWKHLAYNALVNGVRDANRLDGWGDLGPGQLTMHVTDVSLEEGA